MQNPDEDTQWNDVLRAKGIIPQKEKEITEEDIVGMVESTIHQKSQGKDMSEMDKDELDELEDDIGEEEERMFQMYRMQRLAEMRETAAKSKFGRVMEITKVDWVKEINSAGDGVNVVVHVFKEGVPLCKLLNHHLTTLAAKFPATKFVRGVSEVCIEKYPDKNLPTIFIYRDGQMVKQWVGPALIGNMSLTQDQLEWKLSKAGALKSDMEEAPTSLPEDAMERAMKAATADDGNDW